MHAAFAYPNSTSSQQSLRRGLYWAEVVMMLMGVNCCFFGLLVATFTYMMMSTGDRSSVGR